MGLPTQVSPPQIALSDVAPSAVIGVDVVAVPVLADPDHGPTLGPGAAELVDELGEDLFALLDAASATGAVGEVVERVVLDTAGLTNPDLRLVLLVGVGSGSTDDLRRAGAALARHVRGRLSVATSLGALGDDAGLRALVEGLVLGSFEFHWRSTGPVEQPVDRVVLAGMADADSRAETRRQGAGRGRRRLAVPHPRPGALEREAPGLDGRAGRGRRAARRAGDQGVGRGAARQAGLRRHRRGRPGPRPTRRGWSGSTTAPKRGGRKAPHVVLVGKGITFDTGGLSIKSRDNMMLMKRDMTGAGVVLAVMGALADLDCPVRVTGLLPLAENSVGARSTRPGDVLRHYGGRTTEVTNTDAEGRLVLADAMAYAVAELAPDALVDVATLTGAMKIALGQRTGGFFANDDALATTIRTASLAAGEPLWRMPLVADYEERISSKVADADNAGGGPGAITAALFLQHFAGGLPWAHLDIASVGDSPTDELEWTKGATGFGARALLHWLELREPLAGVST